MKRTPRAGYNLDFSGVKFPEVVEEPLYVGRRNNIRIVSDHKAIVNPATGEHWCIVSKRYHLIRHEVALASLDKVLKAYPEYGIPEVDISFAKDGGLMKAAFRFPEVKTHVGYLPGTRRKDFINPKVEIFNSYNMAWAFKIMFGAYRLVCSNGLVIGHREFYARRIHVAAEGISTQELLSFMMENLSGSMERYSERIELWKTWLDQLIPQTRSEEILDKVGFNKTDRAAVEQEVEIGSQATLLDNESPPWFREVAISKWILFNILCQYITHHMRLNMAKQLHFQNRVRRLF